MSKDPFKRNSSLINKPKLFFFQACRGNQEMSSVDKIRFDSVVYKDDVSDIFKVPIEADFLFSYSTVKGYVSIRDEYTGTWFIQTLCDVISNEPNKDILNILTEVNNKISQKIEIKTMPTFESRLKKSFYFKPKVNKVKNTYEAEMIYLKKKF